MFNAVKRTVVQLTRTVTAYQIRRAPSNQQIQRSLAWKQQRRTLSSNAGENWLQTTRDRDEDVSILKENIPPGDILAQSIKSATQPEELLRCVAGRGKDLTPNIAFLALRNLFQLHKHCGMDISREQVLEDKSFELICKSVRSGLRLWNTNNLIDILKIVTYFGVPTTSIMVQSVLHLLRDMVNDLSINQIIFLSRLCKKCKRDVTVKSLELALPIVFEANLKIKLQRDSPGQVFLALEFAGKYKVSEEAFDLLVTAASTHQIESLRDAFTVARTLAMVPLPHPLKSKLFSEALDFLLDNGVFQEYSMKEMQVLLNDITKRCKKDTAFYHEKFFDAFANQMVQNKESVYSCILTCTKLMSASHISTRLLDYICESLVENSDELRSHAWILAPFKLVNIIAISGYVPSKWNEALAILIETLRTVPEGKLEYPWVKLAFNLLNLGHVEEKLLAHIFSEKYLEEFLNANQALDCLQVFQMYSILKILHPEYTGPLPSEKILDFCHPRNFPRDKEYPLQSYLESGFGGSQYLLTNVLTKVNLSDHAVVIRKGGYPVALNSNAEQQNAFNLEELDIPADSQLLIINYLKKGSCSPVPGRHRFLVQSTIACLEKLGCKTVYVSEPEWIRLAEHEKVAYLMQRVKESARSQFEAEQF